jgi:antirestriction protein ArdC
VTSGAKSAATTGNAREELVAELTSTFDSTGLELAGEPAAQIAHWLKALKDDKRFIFHAATHAQKACLFAQLQPQVTTGLPGPHAQRMLESRQHSERQL